jgi:leucyl-tRNA synthetase
MDTHKIEEKWRKRWEEARLFEANVDSTKEKKFITAAFPYPNSPQHIGHGRTYTTADIYARYLRMRGYNVLFPMAFHVTGTPIIAMARRLAEGDEEIITIFEHIYGISKETIASLKKPEDLVMYFSKEIEQGMREMGYSIDWRRKFYTFDKKFNRFIEWQFKKLRASGYIVQGEHPVAWCPNDKQALGAHDTKGDVDPELEEVTVIKFPLVDDDGSLIVTTYRPETIYGVTNIWVNQNAKYVSALYNNEKVYLTKNTAVDLKSQLNLEILGEHDGSFFIGKYARNVVTGNTVPIFSASFVNENEGTGVVMSVPAHAPYDYLALRDIGKADIEMPQVIELKGFGKNPAKECVERLGVKSQNDPLAEKATKEIYTKESHEGIMLVGQYAGMPVKQAKELVKRDLIEKKIAFTIYTIANAPVYCRCGARAVVNIIKNQWFIDYENAEWKKLAKECLSTMRIIPEKSRAEYLYAIDWFKQKACARAHGLGTPLPFDKSQMIEALSDSTIYMAFYTIAHMLDGIDENEMDEAFFDYVFLGKGKGNKKLDELRRTFLYWYPLDSRHSGADLIRNHLPFFIFNHVAIFPRQLWPRQIVTNGFVLMEGKKMSKSMGNILPLRKAIAEYGADVVRFSVVAGADLTQDTDFNKTVADGTKARLQYIAELIEKSVKNKIEKTEAQRIDRWLISRLNRKIKRASVLYEQLELRQLALEIFYEAFNDLQWYLKRTDKPNLRTFFEQWVPLIAPFMPYHAEEFWEMLGKKPFVSCTPFPVANERAIDEKVEMGEELVKSVAADIAHLEKILNKKPKKIDVFVANEIKRKIYEIVRSEKQLDKIMKIAAQDHQLKTHMDVVQRVTKSLIKNAHSLPLALSTKEELDALKDAEAFLSKEFGCPVSVMEEDESKHEKAKNALPNKPAIVLE